MKLTRTTSTFILFRAVLILCMVSLRLVTEAQSALVQQNAELAQAFSTKDTVFKTPFIDQDEWRDTPIRHRYVHGGFKGTNTRFSFYFPLKEQYQGRFFQYITPFPDSETLSQGAKGEDDKIGFSLSSGAYFIETNGGGRVDFAKPSINSDPTIGAFRANAAAAAFSKVVAQKLFGNHRTYGYAFGGSGGAYRTIGCIENTDGVWDGVVPYVLGSPMAIPNVFSVRMHAMRILNDKLSQIIDVMDAGGSGDMYAGLNEEEKQALSEVTKMGFPPQSWFGYKTMGIHGFIVLYQGMKMADRKFFDDFWTIKGYLGANPTASLVKARLQKASKIKLAIPIDEAVKLGIKEPMSAGERGSADLAWKSIGGTEGAMPVAFQLEDVLPTVNFLGGDLIIKSGVAAGKTIQVASVVGDKVVFGPVDPAILAQIKIGDEVFVDNSSFLAVQTYHRHQVPGKEYKVWDQFRDSVGNPLYPQRPMLLGPSFTRGAAGVLPTGKFKGKMILLCSLWDREAFAWQGDFYREKVKVNLGDATDDSFRLWYTDRALHGDLSKQEDPTRTVSYLGVLQQALRDLSAWCEKGVLPPTSTNYTIEDGQVLLPPSAAERQGIQPVVRLTVKGKKKCESTINKRVTFKAEIELPPHTGKIVLAEWDFEGEGTYPVKQNNVSFNKKSSRTTVTATHKFSKNGIYFPALRISAQREGDSKTAFARIQNLDRVRVMINSPAQNGAKNYSIIPKLPPAPKPELFTVTTINLPQDVFESDLVNYLPDGEHLIMEVHYVGKKKSDLAVMKEDGSNFKCLTCNLNEEIGDEMPVPLPDGKTVYSPRGVLECSPSIVDCKEAKILPLVYPDIPDAKIVRRIATNMSPNGKHVATGLVTTKGYLVLVSELTRVSDEKGERYELQNGKVVASSPNEADFAAFRPKIDGAGEVKSFADGGKSLINLALFESTNYDLAKIDLTNGSITRLTKHFSYDEGTYPSPDGNWVIFQTHRHTTRMDAFGLIPRPLIAGMPQAAGVSMQRNAEFEENYKATRFYGLTMTDKYGDRVRLPEEGYTGISIMTDKEDAKLYNHLGNFAWHPSSTRGFFWEQKDPETVKEGELSGRLRFIKFSSRKPTTPLPAVFPDMKWATDLKDFKWVTTNYPEQGILKGKVSGHAEISMQKQAPGSSEEPRRIIKYVNFTDDGVYILNGSESSTLRSGGYDKPVSWDADIIVSGKYQGFLMAKDVKFRVTSRSSGTIKAQLGKRKIDVDLAKGLPTGVPGVRR